MTEERLPLAELLAKAGDGDFLRSVAEAVVQLLMETDAEGLIGAGRPERSGDRTAYRDGCRDRRLDTRLGALQLRIPKLRQGRSFDGGRQPALVDGVVHFVPGRRPMSCTSPSALAAQTGSDRASITLYISLELSPSKWLVTSLVSGVDKMSEHLVPGGDCRALLQLLAALKAKAEHCSNMSVTVAAIQEAGLAGFSLHRLLEANDIESWIVDPASVAVPRRVRRAKSDAIDGETLLRTLLAYRRGEPRVCSMVRPTALVQNPLLRDSTESQIVEHVKLYRCDLRRKLVFAPEPRCALAGLR
jgi:Transposase, Mutator family